MDIADVKEFVKRGRKAQSAVDVLLKRTKEAKTTTAKTECAYDGTRQVDAGRRCVLCGFRRKDAVIATQKWEQENRRFMLRA